ncbi:MAG TPA: hypothetical protein VFW28_14975 [Micropepsaceae bacterium]|nr:hypothetical protein [Micropepsaceae bacterium]
MEMQNAAELSHEQSHSHRNSHPQKRSRHNGSAHLPRAHLIHRMPGRARFRIRQHRNDQDYFDTLADRMRRVPGVRDVETNATTGSVLVQHDGPLEDVVEAMLDHSEVGRLIHFVLQSPPIANRLRTEITVMDNAVQRFTGGEFDLGTVASFGLLGLSAVQLLLGQQLASSVSLAWYAAELIRRSSNGQPIGTPPD